MSDFEGGARTVFSPDGRTVATVAFSGQPALWNVGNSTSAWPFTGLRADVLCLAEC